MADAVGLAVVFVVELALGLDSVPVLGVVELSCASASAGVAVATELAERQCGFAVAQLHLHEAAEVVTAEHGRRLAGSVDGQVRTGGLQALALEEEHSGQRLLDGVQNFHWR